MNVKIDSAEYKVSICKEHEDDALPKKVRELVQGKATEIEKIKEMAAKYGLTVGEQKAGPQKTTAQPSGHSALHQNLKPQRLPSGQPSEMEEAPLEEPIEMPPSNVVEGASDVRLEKHDSYGSAQGNKTPTVTARQSKTYKTESGREINVPSVIYDDEGGKTDIKIVNTGGDRALQNRFKGMAEGSKGGGGPDFRNQYSVRDCTACGGSGGSRVSKSKPCPKCGGDGIFKG